MQLLDRYKNNLKGDILGGLTAAIVAIPTALAFGLAATAGADPSVGLYTAIFLCIVASVIGGTQTLISDPTAPMTLIAAGIIAQASGDFSLILPIFLCVGIFQIVFSAIGVARYVKYIPYPVISGFMGGIGVIIIGQQLLPLIGHANPKDKSLLNIFETLFEKLGEIDGASFAIGSGTIAVIYLIPLVSKKIPAILFALVVSTLVVYFGEFDLAVVGKINPEFKMADLSSLSDFDFSKTGFVITSAITLAALGTIDTLLTSVVADNITKTKHNGRRELLGQGLGNFVTALFGGIPGAGSTSGTVINAKSGAKTHLSGISKGVFLLLIVLFLSDAIQYVPMAALAGILFTVGIGVIDIRGIKMLIKVPKAEALVLILTLLVTVFDDLLHAVALGALLSTVFFMEKMSKVVEDLNKEGSLKSFAKKEKLPEGLAERVHVIRLDGPVFFGFADDFKSHLDEISNVGAVVIDLKRVPFTDQTGLMTLEDSIRAFQEEGIHVFIVGANDAIYGQMEKVGIPGGLISEDHFYPYFRACVKHLKHLFHDHIPSEHKL